MSIAALIEAVEAYSPTASDTIGGQYIAERDEGTGALHQAAIGWGPDAKYHAYAVFTVEPRAKEAGQ